MQYCGAHTGRWAGRGFQPHNLPRVSPKDEKEFAAMRKKLKTFEVPLVDSADAINTMIRPLLIPRKGYVYLTGDLSAIEARLTFWISDCKKGLAAYKANADVYKVLAGEIFNCVSHNVTPQQRLIGKKGILALGYGMGSNRFKASLAEDGVKVRQEFADKVVKVYRHTYPEIKKTWYALRDEFYRAIDHPRRMGEFRGCTIGYDPDGGLLRVTLPSGRHLYFWGVVKVHKELQRWHPRKKVEKLWGGTILENIVQSIARDILATQLLECRRQSPLTFGRPVLTVHDEIIIETPIKHATKALVKFQEIMTTTPDWVSDLPLGAECKVVKRYGK